jgi:N-glycosylase/DNA lyase
MSVRVKSSPGEVALKTSAHWTADFPLRGPAGEAIDLRRVFFSHGVASLPPMSVEEKSWTFELTLPLPGQRPRIVRVTQARPGYGQIEVLGRAPGEETQAKLMAGIRHVLSLDLDLSGFYRMVETDRDLAWVASGAGRMIRSPTVFEDVVKTICTTNCSWAATKRMVGALVEHLGEKAPGAPDSGTRGRAFPTAEAMAAAGEPFYRKVAGAGYRGAYLRSLARSVASGRVDLEALGRARREEIPDGEIEDRLLELPGVGSYAAAHVMLMMGRYSKLILDSWTRPTYARLCGRKSVKDGAIVKRFRQYGPYAGLAFWLFLTRDWVAESEGGVASG